MSFLKSLFSKPVRTFEDWLFVDMHSHLIPGIDDGSKTLEESIHLIQELQKLGYKKIITTPHIMGDFFKNSKETIVPGLTELKAGLLQLNINVEVEAAAEYYLDEWFIEKLEQNEPLLTLHGKYVLFETSYMNKPAQLHRAIFLMRSLGYIPVLAHPERYTYLYSSFDLFKEIYEMDVLFQINLNSLAGYYSKSAKAYAEKLIDNKMVDFVGTDCHGKRHLDVLATVKKTGYYQKLQKLNILNNTLIS